MSLSRKFQWAVNISICIFVLSYYIKVQLEVDLNVVKDFDVVDDIKILGGWKIYCFNQRSQKINSEVRGVLHPDQFFDCLCIFLKNYNTLVTSKICFL